MFANKEYVAVIDGAGDAQGRRWQGLSYGVHAAAAVKAGLECIDSPSSPRILIDGVTERLARLNEQLTAVGLGPPWPAANFVVYSKTLQAVVRVGDCSFSFDDVVHHAPMKRFEELLVEVRKFIVGQALRSGMEVSLAEQDVRAAFEPLYRYQESCQNEIERGPYSFAVLDGSRVPDWGIEVFPLPSGTREVSLLSDGYPVVRTTFVDAEEELAKILESDPQLLGEFAQSKFPKKGGESFDDRSFVRFRVS